MCECVNGGWGECVSGGGDGVGLGRLDGCFYLCPCRFRSCALCQGQDFMFRGQILLRGTFHCRGVYFTSRTWDLVAFALLVFDIDFRNDFPSLLSHLLSHLGPGLLRIWHSLLRPVSITASA